MLTTADFRAERVALRGITPQGVSVVGADGKHRTVEFDRMLQIDRASAPSTGATRSADRFVLTLSGGERFAGEPKGLDGETLLWTSPALGEVKAPLSRVQRLARSNAAAAAPRVAGPRTEDVITLANGDTVRGIVAGVTGTSVSIQSSGGEATEVPLDSIASVDFAAVADPGAANAAAGAHDGRAFRVSLADSTSITAPSLELKGQNLTLNLADKTSRQVPLGAVTSIEQVNGPVIWLSTRTPVEEVQTPFLADRTAPARMNATATGEPIAFGDRTFARGIGVHSYSRLAWEFDGSRYKAFRTQYAIDGQLPYANVIVRIKLDDRVAHEQKDFRAGTLAPPVVIDTGNAKRITLEVDYGDTYDVQDRFNWIEPALLKEKPRPPEPPKPLAPPSTSPATQPSTRATG